MGQGMQRDSDVKVRQAIYSPKQFRRGSFDDPVHRGRGWTVWHWVLVLSLAGVAIIAALDQEVEPPRPVASGVLVRSVESSGVSASAPVVVQADLSKRTEVAGYLVRIHDWNTGRPTAALLVAPGVEVATSLPVGDYRVEILEGPVWHGPARLFGDKVRVSQAVEPLRLYMAGEEVHGARLRLSAGAQGTFTLARPR